MSAKLIIRVKTAECALTKREVTIATAKLDTTEKTVNTVITSTKCLTVLFYTSNHVSRKFLS